VLFNKLPIFILENLFQSPQFQIEHEDILFTLVVGLIKKDPNRKSLLKFIYFPTVSTSLLINYFSNFSVEDIDSALFESIKTRFFCDVIMPTSLSFKSRWQNLPTSHTKEEIEEIFQLLRNHFHHTANPAELIGTLFRENEEMKNQLQITQSENEKIKHKNVRLKNQNQKL
jgi:hypothetical protein